MNIQPVGKNILIDINQVKKVGELVTENKKTIHESGVVVAKGPDVTLQAKAGDILLVKGWAVDSIKYEDQEYFFVNEESGGICGIVIT